MLLHILAGRMCPVATFIDTCIHCVNEAQTHCELQDIFNALILVVVYKGYLLSHPLNKNPVSIPVCSKNGVLNSTCFAFYIHVRFRN